MKSWKCAVARFSHTTCLALAAALALSVRPALACGICVEDQVSATYDHDVLIQAEAAGRDVLYTAVRGRNAGSPRSHAVIRRALAVVAGVDRDSIRLSVLPPAASFAWDSKHHASGAILRAVNDKLAKSGLTLVALRTLGRSETIRTGRARVRASRS